MAAVAFGLLKKCKSCTGLNKAKIRWSHFKMSVDLCQLSKMAAMANNIKWHNSEIIKGR
jgi:hypothetical protein